MTKKQTAFLETVRIHIVGDKDEFYITGVMPNGKTHFGKRGSTKSPMQFVLGLGSSINSLLAYDELKDE